MMPVLRFPLRTLLPAPTPRHDHGGSVGLLADGSAAIAERPRVAGFSLVEALVAVAILAILAGLAAPSFNDLIAAQRAGTAASDLHIALTKTRSEATKRNANVTLARSGEGWHFGWRILSPADSSVIDEHAAIGGLSITGPATVVYQGSGRIQGSSPTFLITSTTNSSVQRCVTVDLSGRPYVKKSSC